eukprot:13527506-Alexandrium_andersonii.AAC.1
MIRQDWQDYAVNQVEHEVRRLQGQQELLEAEAWEADRARVDGMMDQEERKDLQRQREEARRSYAESLSPDTR